MKIAVCLSGQPRFIRESSASLKNHLLDHNDCDLYIHAWCVSKFERFTSAQPGQDGARGHFDPNTLSILDDLGGTLAISTPIDFSEYTAGFAQHYLTRQDQLASMFYSSRSAGELLKASGKRYDVVIRARLDLIYLQPLKIDLTEDELSETFWAPAKWQDVRTDGTANDCFGVSSQANMEAAFGVYDIMREINAVIDPVPLGENYFGYALSSKGIKIKSRPFEVELSHRLLMA